MFSKSALLPPISNTKMAAEAMEASFPSELERTVASALLLLSNSSPKRGGDCRSSTASFESSGFSKLKSNRGSWTAEPTVDEKSSCARQLTVVAFVSEFDELKLKIVRKKRSKAIWISEGKKSKTSNLKSISAPTSSESVSEISTSGTPSFSSTCSPQSFTSNSSASINRRKTCIPRDMEHRAEAILRILSTGSASEVTIRQLLGDSPSTSKALRILLKLDEVKRAGAGGRNDPYVYKIA